MKQAVLFAVQILLIWTSSKAISKEEPEPTLWVLHSSLNSQLYNSDQSGETHSHQQHGQYSGITVKPLRFGWFHGGLKSRWTQAAKLSEVYSEPATLKLATGLKVYKDLVYVMAGMALPLVENQIPKKDTSAFASILNNYSPLTEQNIMTLNAVEAGGYLNHTLGALNGKLGVSYYRPSSYELYENRRNFHSDLINYRLQLTWITPGLLNVFEGKFTGYGEEKDRKRSDLAVHSEGFLSQMYYAIKFHIEGNGLETGLGAALKTKDANLKITGSNSSLEEEDKNSNIQRYYVNIAWVQTLWNNNPFKVRLAPQYLTRASADESGFQTNFNTSYKFKLTQKNILNLQSYFTYGSLGEQSLIGGGIVVGITFHGNKSIQPRLFPKRADKLEP